MLPKTLPNAGAVTATLVPLPPPRVRLSTVKQVRLELSRLYSETKAGHIDPTSAAKLAFILDRVRVCIADHELESRVMLLEQLIEEQKHERS